MSIPMKKKSVFLILTLTLVVFSSVYLVELFLFSFEKFSNKQKTFKSKHQYFLQVNPNFDNLFPVYHPNLENDDFVTFGTKPFSNNLFCNESGEWSYFKSDRFGFNNFDQNWDKKNHVLLIGDSYVQGACVDQESSISFLLKDKGINNVVNLSNSGIGPISELTMLSKYQKFLKTKKIFWFYYEGNDLNDLEREIENEYLLRAFKDGNFKKLNDPTVQKLIEDIYEQHYQKYSREVIKKNKWKEIIYLQRLRNYLYIFKTIYYPIRSDKKNLFDSITKRFKFYADQFRSDLYFVYIPSYHRYSTYKIFNFDKFNKEKIINIVTDNKIEIIDLDNIIFTSENYKKYFINISMIKYNKLYYFINIFKINNYI